MDKEKAIQILQDVIESQPGTNGVRLFRSSDLHKALIEARFVWESYMLSAIGNWLSVLFPDAPCKRHEEGFEHYITRLINYLRMEDE